MNASTVLIVGDTSWDVSVLVDHVPDADEKVHTQRFVEDAGGVAANAAVASVVTGAPTTLATVVGTDVAGAECVRRMADRGVHVVTETVVGTTNRAFILLDASGEKRLILATDVPTYPSEGFVADLDLSGVGWLHTAVYGRAAATVLTERCRRAGIPWSIDLEPATLTGGLGEMRQVLDGAAVVFCNTRATDRLGENPVRALRSIGVRAVVLTRGADGATLADTGGTSHVPAPSLADAVVDTTGAGDCLAGSFTALAVRGVAFPEALGYAVTAASLSCRRLGTQITVPTRVDVEAARTPQSRREGAGNK